MDNVLHGIVVFFASFTIVYMLIVITIYLVMTIVAFFNINRTRKLDKDFFDESVIESVYTKPVSIIVPAFNEAVGIVNSVRALTNLKYPKYEIIVVNDGSTDDTEKEVIEHFQMVPVEKVIQKQLETEEVKQIFQSTIQSNVFLVNKDNGGKADAINAGINVSRYPYFCTIDADSILEVNSLLRVMKPILMSNDDVVAVGGNVRVGNGNEFMLGSLFQEKFSNNLFVVTQIVEYLRAFLIGRLSLSKINSVLILSGAFSVFSKEWALKVDGYSKNMIGEDMEIIVKLHRYFKKNKLDKRIEYVPDPVCWTEAPQNISDLRKQRRRWQQGLLDTLKKHVSLTFNPRYKSVGMLSFPYFWFVETIGPLIEFGGYIFIIVAFFLGDVYLEYAFLLMLLLIFYGVIFSLLSIVFESWTSGKYPRVSDLLKMFLTAFLEVFWYRPITLIFRLEGILRSIFRRKDWGHMKRKGFNEGGPSS